MVTPIWQDIGNDQYNTARSDYTFNESNKLFQYDPLKPVFSGDYVFHPVSSTNSKDIIYIVLKENDNNNFVRALEIDIDASEPVSTLWETNLGSSVYGLRTALSPDGQYLGVGGHNHKRFVLNSMDGTIKWEKEDRPNFAQRNNIVFFDDNNNLYFGFARKREFWGEIWWRSQLSKININGDVEWRKTIISSDLSGAKNYLYSLALEEPYAYCMVGNNIESKLTKIQTIDGAFSGSVTGDNPVSLNYQPKGLAMEHESQRLFVTGQEDDDGNSGLKMYDTFLDLKDQHVSSASPNGHPSISTDGTIYYVADTNLYAIETDGSTLSTKWSYNLLPSGSHTATPIIDNAGRIIVCTNSDSSYQVYMFEPDGITPPTKIALEGSGNIKITPTIGKSTIYFTTTSPRLLFGYGGIEPTTTTTSSTTSTTSTTSGTTSTTSTTTSGTTSTTTPTTTTTTTTYSLNAVITDFFQIQNNEAISIINSNASDNQQTVSTPFASSMNFGTMAPGQTSRIIIANLKVPSARAITNIKLGLTNTGGIEFNNNTFGIETSSELRTDIVPSNHFKGINQNESESNTYNIHIPNRNEITSEYVYLNITMPKNNSFTNGTIRYKWFFDYAN